MTLQSRACTVQSMTKNTELPARPLCMLNHGAADVQRCGREATHLVKYASWARFLPSCRDLAMEGLDHGADVVSFDALEHAVRNA